jgi:peptidoglycan/xylan/chitin deacetylase (PgdA/CDA1 family)
MVGVAALALGVAAVAAGASAQSDAVIPKSCTQHGPPLRFNGHRNEKRVALTFDDGPSAYTPAFVSTLHRLNAHATFFEIGQEVPGNSEVMKRLLADGNEIGNHTTHHTIGASEGDLAETQRLIEKATGFRPCMFRPPDGALSSGLVASADDLGMTTVVWDVDPRDWATPGAGAIRARVVGAVRPGSIVVMHDGGGNRSGTLAALPKIVHDLRHRGYRLATVSQLLGSEMVY